MKPRYLQNTLNRFFVVLKEKGPVYVIVFVFNHILAYPICKLFQIFNKGTIYFAGEYLPLFFHVHNHTWLNSRMIEVPIFKYILEKYQIGGRTLEVGNVMSHYFNISHEVVDKYDRGKGVINEDIVHFTTNGKYDLIISISTLEHIGYDEGPIKEPEKLLKVIDVLKSLIVKGGEIYISVPIGENPFLDEYLRKDEINLEKVVSYIRIGMTKWLPTNYENVAYAKYNKPYRWGNAFVILHWKAKQ